MTRRTPATTGLTPAQFAAAKEMSEERLLSCVIDACRTFGLFVAHFRTATVGAGDRRRHITPVQGDGKGYLDLTIVGGRVIWRELKSFRGRLSPEQENWIARIDAAGGDAGVWTPIDWMSGRIVDELGGMR